jgi:parvulin-like peptidyl-prolyl isomerase
MPLDRIEAMFGQDFGRALAMVSPGHWAGPLQSAYGWHLVLITAAQAAPEPSFETVRAAVEREWYAERRATAQATQYQELRAGYRVVLPERPAGRP